MEGAELHGLALPMEGEMEHVAHYLLLPRPDTITESYLLGVHLTCGAAAFGAVSTISGKRCFSHALTAGFGFFSH